MGILYTLLEKMQGFTQEMYGEMDIQHLEQMHEDRLGDTIAQIEALTVTKRFVGTGAWFLFSFPFPRELLS